MGSFKLYIETPSCPSCALVIEDFRTMLKAKYPHVTMDIETGPYKP